MPIYEGSSVEICYTSGNTTGYIQLLQVGIRISHRVKWILHIKNANRKKLPQEYQHAACKEI
jgi:hypothetical protein